MKKTLTYLEPVIASTASRLNPAKFDHSIELFDEGKYLESFYALLDYIDSDLRKKHGNAAGTEFHVPHGSIIVDLRIEGDRLFIEAPFLSLPEKGRIPLLRQVAGLNINVLDLAVLRLKDNKLSFSYDCPLDMAQPAKIYNTLYDICTTGDRYDDEFATKFGAIRIYEPEVKPYSPELIERIYNGIQLCCRECLEGLKDYETERRTGYMWNLLSATLYKIFYFANPQGQLLNELDAAIRQLDRNDIPQSEVLVRGREFIQKLQATPCEKLAEDLYFVETFVSDRRRSNLKNIQDNFEESFDNADGAYDAGNAMACCVIVVQKFYEMYYYNNVQDDVNAVVVKALKESGDKPWDEAAPILHDAMDNIMDGNLEIEEEVEEDMSGVDVSALQEQITAQAAAMQAQMEQAMGAGFDMNAYMQNMMKMMGGAAAADTTTEEKEEKKK